MSTCFWPNRRACNFSLKLRAEEGSMKHSDNNFIEHLNRLLSSNSVAISFSGNLDHTCQNWFGKRVQKITRKGRESDMKNYCRNRRDLKKRTTSIGIYFAIDGLLPFQARFSPILLHTFWNFWSSRMENHYFARSKKRKCTQTSIFMHSWINGGYH